MVLEGLSEVVAGEPYRIHFTVPAGYRVKTCGVSSRDGLGTLSITPGMYGGRVLAGRVRKKQKI